MSCGIVVCLEVVMGIVVCLEVVMWSRCLSRGCHGNSCLSRGCHVAIFVEMSTILYCNIWRFHLNFV